MLFSFWKPVGCLISNKITMSHNNCDVTSSHDFPTFAKQPQGARPPFGARFPHRLLFYSHGEGGLVEAWVPWLSTFSFTSSIPERGLWAPHSKGTTITLKVSVNGCVCYKRQISLAPEGPVGSAEFHFAVGMKLLGCLVPGQDCMDKWLKRGSRSESESEVPLLSRWMAESQRQLAKICLWTLLWIQPDLGLESATCLLPLQYSQHRSSNTLPFPEPCSAGSHSSLKRAWSNCMSSPLWN